ncbi:MAG: TetR/AcrR family transcriptional regulator [Pseudomonadales bacterium]|nr:TetR/AcrR family transcriptional regulator [Pseudomonadales bacterium]
MNDVVTASIAPGRLQRKRERTRASLLTAARALVLERGHEPLSIQDITTRADVGLGTFYNYFETKTAIFEAVIDEMRAEFLAELDEVRARLKDPAMIVAATLSFCLDRGTLNDEWNRFVTYSGLPGEYVLLPEPEQCLADIRRGASAGRFKVDDVAFTQGLILGIVRHVNREIMRGHLGRKAIADTTRHVLRMLGLPDLVARAIVQTPLPPVAAGKKDRGDDAAAAMLS